MADVDAARIETLLMVGKDLNTKLTSGAVKHLAEAIDLTVVGWLRGDSKRLWEGPGELKPFTQMVSASLGRELEERHGEGPANETELCSAMVHVFKMHHAICRFLFAGRLLPDELRDTEVARSMAVGFQHMEPVCTLYLQTYEGKCP